MQPPEIHIFLKSPKSQSKECHIIFDYDQGKKKFFWKYYLTFTSDRLTFSGFRGLQGMMQVN